ncbi:MAG: hypothetical protein FJX57_23240, partial [Alphaproteobacteria bacterium]|nr:hypothetical protein [Alphaproteobacteria bacterium]
MTTAADGSAILAQAAPANPPESRAARRTLVFRRNERQTVDLQAGDAIRVEALPAAVSYRRLAEGLLLVGPDGSEILLRVAPNSPVGG